MKIAASIVCAVTGAGSAAVAVSSIGSGTESGAVNGEYGWSFTLASDITVTHLGVWDAQMDGLEQTSTEVRLWGGFGDLRAIATVPGGTAAELIDGFRYVDIPDIVLDADHGSYYVSASNFFALSGGQSFFQADGTGLETTGPVSLLGPAQANNPAQFPSSNTLPFAAYFGANFLFVPAPSATAALIVAGVVAGRRRRGG